MSPAREVHRARGASPAAPMPGSAYRSAAGHGNGQVPATGTSILSIGRAEGGEAKSLVPGEDTASAELVQALVRKRLTPAMRANLGMAGSEGIYTTKAPFRGPRSFR